MKNGIAGNFTRAAFVSVALACMSELRGWKDKLTVTGSRKGVPLLRMKENDWSDAVTTRHLLPIVLVIKHRAAKSRLVIEEESVLGGG